MVGDSCACCACVSVDCASVPASPAMNVRRLMQSPHRPRQGKDNMARELEKSGSKIAQVCNGSKCEELNVSKSSPLYLSVRTSTGQADTSQKGQQPTWSGNARRQSGTDRINRRRYDDWNTTGRLPCR